MYVTHVFKYILLRVRFDLTHLLTTIMDENNSNVRQYLTNVLDYFAVIRQHYYSEHAQLQKLNTQFGQLWDVITNVLRISDPSILRRGRAGDISAEEVELLLKTALDKYTTSPSNNDIVLEKLDAVSKILIDNNDEERYDSHAVDHKLKSIKEEHTKHLKILSENTTKIDNAIAFHTIFSTIRAPVVNHFTT